MLSNITLSIVAYNSASVLPACVASVPRDCPVLIFDNASRDDGALLAQRIRPDAQVVRSDTNIGFGNAHNRLLARVRTPFALVLNPDAVLHADTLERLLQAAQDNPKAAIIGALHRDHDGRVEPSFRPFNEAIDAVTEVEMISGAVMLLRMEAFEGVFFDPKIFLYFEDDDICLAARKRGWKVIVQPQAHITHTPGMSSGKPTWNSIRRRYYHFAYSRCYFEDKQQNFDPESFRRFVRGMQGKLLKRLLVAAVTLKSHRVARFYGELCGTRAYCCQK